MNGVFSCNDKWKILLKPGEAKTVTFTLDKDTLSGWDEASHAWKLYPGVYTAHVGSSSRDIRVKGTFSMGADVTLEEFRRTLSSGSPPAWLPSTLVALWHDAKGDWDAAHRVAQDIDDEDGSWIHAYLHRKEGDPGNAAYWYSRARKPVSTLALDAEWKEIVAEFLRRV